MPHCYSDNKVHQASAFAAGLSFFPIQRHVISHYLHFFRGKSVSRECLRSKKPLHLEMCGLSSAVPFQLHQSVWFYENVIVLSSLVIFRRQNINIKCHTFQTECFEENDMFLNSIRHTEVKNQ